MRSNQVTRALAAASAGLLFALVVSSLGVACSSSKAPADASALERHDALSADADGLDDVASGSDLDASSDAFADVASEAADSSSAEDSRRVLLREFSANSARFHLKLTAPMSAEIDATCAGRATKKGRAVCRSTLLDELATMRVELVRVRSKNAPNDASNAADVFDGLLTVRGLDAKGQVVEWHRIKGHVRIEVDRLTLQIAEKNSGVRAFDAAPSLIVIQPSSPYTLEIEGLERERLQMIRM